MKKTADLPPPSSWVDVPSKGTKSAYTAPSHISIRQPDGTRAPIPTLEPDEAATMLGFNFAPFGDSSEHVSCMVEKGLDWVDSVTTRPLPPRDAWFSFQHQLYPGVSWGLAAVVLSPTKVEAEFQRLYYRALPVLNVNRNITKEWRMLPEMFQGLGLPNMNLRMLGAKIHFLHCTWGFTGAAADLLTFSFESFMVEVGIYGNIFEHKFREHSLLASEGTWFKHLWQLLDVYNATLTITEPHCIQPVRARDRSLNECLLLITNDKSVRESFNVTRKYYELIHASEILDSDGCTMNPQALSGQLGPSESHDFPLERPSRKDFTIFREYLPRIAALFRTTLPSLGGYLCENHLACRNGA